MTAPEKAPPPSDLEAEASVLGAILYDQRHVSAVPPKLRPGAFYSGGPQHVFRAACELRDQGVDVNKVSVAARLRLGGRLRQLEGGDAYLDRLVNHVPVITASTFEMFCTRVLDTATQRAAILVLH